VALKIALPETGTNVGFSSVNRGGWGRIGYVGELERAGLARVGYRENYFGGGRGACELSTLTITATHEKCKASASG
jgi:hypothetical protein